MDPEEGGLSWAGGRITKASEDIDKYAFFLSKDEVPFGCFSNAFRESGEGHVGLIGSSSVEAGAESVPRFWCVNQELHYRKAKLFGDDGVADLILAEAEDAGKIKQLGRTVRGYDDDKWATVRYGVARDAVHAKFAKDDRLEKILVDTGSKMIIEAAADKVWGVGVLEWSTEERRGIRRRNAGGWDIGPDEWKGTNLLGRCLMDVRDELQRSS